MSQSTTIRMSEFDVTGTEPLSRTVYGAVAEAKGVDPLDLPPLAQVIDGESLDKFVAQSSDNLTFSVQCEYAGCRVTITETEISIDPKEDS
ncbi:hypothetical protein BRD00_08970 [Halobacteriales archaeon QS_8_69_26]|nr:MAG: hypothetical protein BRD00_08970 [Halobacteriales archaeon QS_8_69_26]